jgi:hypothetical protein
MPVFRTTLVVVSIFLAVLYVYDICRSDGLLMAIPVSDIIARRWPEPDEFRPIAAPASAAATTATPAARVRETFAMFIPGDGRRRAMQRSL